MNKATLKALQGSIKKWQKIVDGEGRDKGPVNCPLCQKFFSYDDSKSCIGCPVFEKTDKIYCNGSPYEKWDVMDFNTILAKKDRGYNFKDHTDAKHIARAELKFLQRLLPKDATKP